MEACEKKFGNRWAKQRRLGGLYRKILQKMMLWCGAGWYGQNHISFLTKYCTSIVAGFLKVKNNSFFSPRNTFKSKTEVKSNFIKVTSNPLWNFVTHLKALTFKWLDFLGPAESLCGDWLFTKYQRRAFWEIIIRNVAVVTRWVKANKRTVRTVWWNYKMTSLYSDIVFKTRTRPHLCHITT